MKLSERLSVFTRMMNIHDKCLERKTILVYHVTYTCKRLILCNLKELYAEFKKKYADLKVRDVAKHIDI